MPEHWWETGAVKPPQRRYGRPVCAKCGAQWEGKSICHCAACHLTFTSIKAFDGHRTGLHASDTRRCRTEAEIRARGYEPNKRGHWCKRDGRTRPDYWSK